MVLVRPYLHGTHVWGLLELRLLHEFERYQTCAVPESPMMMSRDRARRSFRVAAARLILKRRTNLQQPPPDRINVVFRSPVDRSGGWMQPAPSAIRQLGVGEVLRGSQWPKHLIHKCMLQYSRNTALKANDTVVLPLSSSPSDRNGKLPERLIKAQADHLKILLHFHQAQRLTSSSRSGSGKALSSFIFFCAPRSVRSPNGA